ncbi:unnamed protein product [Calypogeia fissa]
MRETEMTEMEMGRKNGPASCWKGWRQQRSLVLVIIASILEKADVAVIPAVYREIGLAMHFNPTSIGIFRLVQMLTQAICSPFAGYLALRYKRTRVIAGGAFVSTIATFSIGVSTTFPQIAFSIVLNTLGVSVTWPAIQSLIADATDETNRGTTFGWLQLTSHGGALFGGVTAVLLAGTSVLGVSGWRVAFFLMSALSLLIAVSLQLFADDPLQNSCSSSLGAGAGGCGEGLAKSNTEICCGCGCEPTKLSVEYGGGELADCKAKKPSQVKAASEQWKDMLEDVRLVVGVKTFKVIVLQGMVVSIGWSALSFSTMWLELVGFSHPQTATILGLFVLAGSLGGLFGGFMGDRVTKLFPNSGRIILAQFSTGIAVPFTTILLLVLPVNPSTPFYHGLVLFVMGCCMSWTAPATNYPIMAEVVPTKSRTNVYALEKGFVSILGAFSPPLVGLMSEKIFGYVPVPKGASGKLIVSMDRKNAVALGHAMYACAGLPFLLCCLLFTPLYWYYPRDRDHVRNQQEVGRKLEDIVEGEKAQFCIMPEEEEPVDDENEDSLMLLGQTLRSV